MPEAECAACGAAVWTSNPDAEHYCPDCSGEYASHGEGYQREQARDLRETERRERIYSGRGQEGDAR